MLKNDCLFVKKTKNRVKLFLVFILGNTIFGHQVYAQSFLEFKKDESLCSNEYVDDVNYSGTYFFTNKSNNNALEFKTGTFSQLDEIIEPFEVDSKRFKIVIQLTQPKNIRCQLKNYISGFYQKVNVTALYNLKKNEYFYFVSIGDKSNSRTKANDLKNINHLSYFENKSLKKNSFKYNEMLMIRWFFNGNFFNYSRQQKPLNNTDKEKQMLKQGLLAKYYESRWLRGEKYAKLALQVLNKTGFFGRVADSWMLTQITHLSKEKRNALLAGGTYLDWVKRTNIALANLHAKAVDSDYDNKTGVIPGLLSSTQISQYHEDYFVRHGLPASTFGGSFFFGVRTAFWCHLCDSKL
jgi:hypothetical protein